MLSSYNLHVLQAVSASRHINQCEDVIKNSTVFQLKLTYPELRGSGDTCSPLPLLAAYTAPLEKCSNSH